MALERKPDNVPEDGIALAFKVSKLPQAQKLPYAREYIRCFNNNSEIAAVIYALRDAEGDLNLEAASFAWEAYSGSIHHPFEHLEVLTRALGSQELREHFFQEFINHSGSFVNFLNKSNPDHNAWLSFLKLVPAHRRYSILDCLSWSDFALILLSKFFPLIHEDQREMYWNKMKAEFPTVSFGHILQYSDSAPKKQAIFDFFDSRIETSKHFRDLLSAINSEAKEKGSDSGEEPDFKNEQTEAEKLKSAAKAAKKVKCDAETEAFLERHKKKLDKNEYFIQVILCASPEIARKWMEKYPGAIKAKEVTFENFGELLDVACIAYPNEGRERTDFLRKHCQDRMLVHSDVYIRLSYAVPRGRQQLWIFDRDSTFHYGGQTVLAYISETIHSKMIFLDLIDLAYKYAQNSVVRNGIFSFFRRYFAYDSDISPLFFTDFPSREPEFLEWLKSCADLDRRIESMFLDILSCLPTDLHYVIMDYLNLLKIESTSDARATGVPIYRGGIIENSIVRRVREEKQKTAAAAEPQPTVPLRLQFIQNVEDHPLQQPAANTEPARIKRL